MREWTDLLVNRILREIVGKSCLSLSYIGVDKFTN